MKVFLAKYRTVVSIAQNDLIITHSVTQSVPYVGVGQLKITENIIWRHVCFYDCSPIDNDKKSLAMVSSRFCDSQIPTFHKSGAALPELLKCGSISCTISRVEFLIRAVRVSSVS